jgi:exopolyphosphatase/guanosine-5'-triphosphate,3'-diphosphate pyrophosphatase
MPVVAAIDVGSNALRLAVASIARSRAVRTIEYLREPIRLGDDVFAAGEISPATTLRAIESFIKFREVIDRHGASRIRAVGTSALREARNRFEFIAKVAMASGIEVSPIGGEEEARLACRAVDSKIDLGGKTAIQIDIGGGSAEVTLIEDGQVSTSESFKMGGVRLVQLFGGKTEDTASFVRIVREYLEPSRRFIKTEIGRRKVDLCIGTGGNIETLGELRRTLLHGRSNEFITARELAAIQSRLQLMSVEERVRKLNLRPDRADVILPSSIVLAYLLKLTGLSRIVIPHVGLKDGLLIELSEDLFGHDKHRRMSQVLQSARVIGKKFNFDSRHAETVAGFAGTIFDATKRLHKLGEEEKLLLIAAALLHDIGQFLGMNDHHKHSLYIINAIPIVGLSPEEKRVVANVARYHHKSFPKPRHEAYASLPQGEKLKVDKLSAILRLADAIDFEHAGRSVRLKASLSRGTLALRLTGDNEQSLARWAVRRHSKLFEDVFRAKVQID